jgi:uncharacterized Zn finger protein (UPF0148 family)
VRAINDFKCECGVVYFSSPKDEETCPICGKTYKFVEKMNKIEIEKEKIVLPKETLKTSHYNFTYKLTKKDIEKGEIELDPYFISQQWDLGSKDRTGILFHCLKTIARFGTKNSVEREIQAMEAQIKRLKELTENVL